MFCSVFCKRKQQNIFYQEKVMSIANHAMHALPVRLECDGNEDVEEQNNRV